MSTKEEKKEIRRRILALRDSMDTETRKRGSLLLTERIAGHQWFYRSEYFLCFRLPMPDGGGTARGGYRYQAISGDLCVKGILL